MLPEESKSENSLGMGFLENSKPVLPFPVASRMLVYIVGGESVGFQSHHRSGKTGISIGQVKNPQSSYQHSVVFLGKNKQLPRLLQTFG